MGAKEIRIELGGDVLIAMAANEEFPIGNVQRVAKIMNEYFISEGFEDTLEELNYKWRPSIEYWQMHLKEIRYYLRENRKLFFEFQRSEGTIGFSGNWSFLRKGEFEKVMQYERGSLMTRVDTYNDRCDDGHSKWQLKEPRVRVAIAQ